MPRSKQYVVERLGMQMGLPSIENQRFGSMFSAVAEFVGNRQCLIGRVSTGFAEGIGPEQLMARIIEFHSGKKRVRVIEIIDDVGKCSIVTSVKSPVITVLEIVDAGFSRLPAGRGSEYQTRPGHVDERFAVVIPGCIERTHSLMLLAVTNKIADVHKRAFEVRPDDAPVARSGSNYYSKTGVCVWSNDAFVTRLRIVVPGNGDHVFRENRKQFGILHRDISPEHQLLVIRPHDLENFLQVFEINAAKALLCGESFGLAEAKFEGFVGTDVKERSWK